MASTSARTANAEMRINSTSCLCLAVLVIAVGLVSVFWAAQLGPCACEHVGLGYYQCFDATNKDLSSLPRDGSVERLVVISSKVSDPSIQAISTLPGLREVILDTPEASSESLKSLANSNSLSRIFIDSPSISATGINDILIHSNSLTHLNVANCGLVDHSVFNDGDWTTASASIQLLGFRACSIESLPIARLRNVNALKFLILTDSNLSASAWKDLGSATSVEELTLDGTNITDDICAELARLSHLKFVSVARTKVSDAGLESLAGLGSLERIDVSKAEVSQSGVNATRRRFPGIRIEL